MIFGFALAAGLALDRPRNDALRRRIMRALGSTSIVAGAALGLATLRALRAGGTTANPYRAATALITGGPFAWTRNPGYVGATALYVGVAMRANSLPALVLLPIALALVDRHVVDPEERHLASVFGDAYASYRDRVPRWF